MNEPTNLDLSALPVTKKGQLEKQSSNSLHRSVWKQYTFILNKHTLRYINEVTHEAKELRCDDIVAIDSGTDTKAAQFPITIQFKGPKRQKLYLRAQSKTDHISWLEAFKRIQTTSNPLPIPPPDRPPVPPPDRPPVPPPDRPLVPPVPPPDHPPMPPDRRSISSDRPPVPPDRPPILPPYHSPIFPPHSNNPAPVEDEFGYVYLSDPGFNPPVNDDEQGGYERLPDPDLIPPDGQKRNSRIHISDLAEHINEEFTPEQVLGLTDMLGQLYDNSFKNQHLYVNLEMLLEAVTSTAADNSLLCTDDYQIARPDWATANTDDFNICDLVGTEVVAHISPASITGKQKIGEGQFGDVFIATLHGETPITVAMKTFKNIHNCTQEANFMKEMAQLSKLVHPNIVKMYGIVIEDGQFPAMVMEYLPHSDLKTFLTKNDRPASKLVKYMIDIAMAMNYVSGKGLVHRDLAARNVLVDDNELCKVGDFGLLRELPSDSDIYVPQSDDPVPYRWLALESLTDRHFSVASDVWSYGIVMWEMFKPTKLPYEEFGQFQIASKLKEGYRLPLPRRIPPVLGDIMKACWKEDPSKRPSFLLICTVLTTKALMLQDKDYTYGIIGRKS